MASVEMEVVDAPRTPAVLVYLEFRQVYGVTGAYDLRSRSEHSCGWVLVQGWKAT
jgi:hypothetical protein